MIQSGTRGSAGSETVYADRPVPAARALPVSRRLLYFLPRARSRSFLVGSTGSGKSTLAAALLDAYRRVHPAHALYIIDPKRRFFPVDPDDDERETVLFPDGYKAQQHGTREGVAVFADRITSPGSLEVGATYILQDEGAIHEQFEYTYKHASVALPTMLYLDESFDLVRGTRADSALRRLSQQGREIGVGMMVINQRPRWIDQTWLSEANQLYIGRLNQSEDRKHIVDEVAAQEHRVMLYDPLPKYTWFYSDQDAPARSRRFRLRLGQE